MRKGKYYIANFPACSMKNSLAALSKNVLRNTDRIFKVFQMYTDESLGLSPRRILHNVTQNNEIVFGPKVPRVNTSREVPSSPVKAGSSTSHPSSRLPFTDKPHEVSDSSIAAETATDRQESVESCEKAEIFSRSAEGDPLVVFTTEELEMKLELNKSKEPEVEAKSPQNIKDLIEENSAEIKSVSIIRQLEEIGVEIDIDLLPKPDKKSSEEFEPGSSSAGETKSPSSVEKKSNSPSSGDSKTSGKSSIPCKSTLTVDYSDPNILEFLAERLLSILSCRKKHMKQIYNYFQKIKKDVNFFSNTIMNLKFVVELLPMINEKYFTRDLVKLRSNLISEAKEMLAKVESLMNEIDDDIVVWEKCIEQIDAYDQNYGSLLSTKSESILNFGELKSLESRIKEMCAKADSTVILKDGRREIFLKHSSNFESLMRNFAKFLIITEILKPPVLDVSEEVKEK